MRGKFAKKQGKISKVDSKNTRIQVENVNRKKKNGDLIEVWFNPSKVKIIKLDESDKKRLNKNSKKEEKKELTKEKKEEKNA